jgi:hypothetical protein
MTPSDPARGRIGEPGQFRGESLKGPATSRPTFEPRTSRAAQVEVRVELNRPEVRATERGKIRGSALLDRHEPFLKIRTNHQELANSIARPEAAPVQPGKGWTSGLFRRAPPETLDMTAGLPLLDIQTEYSVKSLGGLSELGKLFGFGATSVEFGLPISTNLQTTQLGRPSIGLGLTLPGPYATVGFQIEIDPMRGVTSVAGVVADPFGGSLGGFGLGFNFDSTINVFGSARIFNIERKDTVRPGPGAEHWVGEAERQIIRGMFGPLPGTTPLGL